MKERRKTKRAGLCALLLAALLMLAAGMPVSAKESILKMPNGKEVYQILLIGTDRRDASWNGNSDVMIVLTINTAAKKMFLTSFMRDLYAEIPGYGVHKLNYAYAAGGAQTLIDTLKDNYDLEIDRYAIVDFEEMSDIVDLAGGVTMTISDEECKWLNGYLYSMSASEYDLPGGGIYVLNGKQAVAYMRIRFVGNNDYERTQRQRNIMEGIFESLKDEDAKTLALLTGEMLFKVDHDIDPVTLLSLTAKLPECMQYELVQQRIPYDGLFFSQNEMLVPDFETTKQQLHDTLYEAAEE